MTADSLRRWCLARPSAVEEFPFGPETSVFKVGGKMFALTALDTRPLTVSLKCEPSVAEALRAEHQAVRPGYHLNKRHWITVTLDDSLPDELVLGLLEDSYELVVDGLPKRERDLVQDASMQIFLETERLVLRRFTEDDVDNLVELDSDPQVMRFINGGRPTPRHEIEHDVLPMFLDYYERFAGYGYWAAVEKSSGRFVGWFHFRPAAGSPPGEVELGYRLRKSVWGKGYASEGSRALIQKGFAELGVRRVFAETMVVNVASRRVMEKAGLKFVRTFHQPWPDKIEGEEEGDVEYALRKSEWEQLLGAWR